MQTLYTVESLAALTLPEVKKIARSVEAAPAEDARIKANWIKAIVAVVEATAGTVPASEFEDAQDAATVLLEPETESQSRPGHVPVTAEEATDIENELLTEIERVGHAEQVAILANDQAEATRLSDRVTELLDQYEAVIKGKIASLAPSLEDLEVAAPPAVQVRWAGDAVGTVTVDGGETCRLFRVLDIYNYPIVKLTTTSGVEIDSRWKTTANNRYILAVMQEIPSQLQKLKTNSAIYEGGELVGYETDDPSIYKYQPTPKKAIGCAEF